MERPAHGTQSALEFTRADQTAYAAPTYRPVAAVTGAPTNGMIPPTFPVLPPYPFGYPQVPQFYQPQQQLLQEFWSNQMQKIEQTTDYKNHGLPLARIKKIMKADKDVRRISSEAPVVLAKACEIFILELTLQSWMQTEENMSRTLYKNDIAGAISRNNKFDFLVDIVPRDEVKEEAGILRALGPGDQMPHYYMSAQADPAAVTVTAGAREVQDPLLSAYMLQQAKVQVTSEAAASTTTGVQDPHLMTYMLQQTQVQATSEAAASSDA